MVVDRRSLLNGTLLSGLAAFAPAQQSRSTSQDNRDDLAVARAINDLNATVQHAAQTSPELARIRDQQRVFLRANQKFPDFIEVGIGEPRRIGDRHDEWPSQPLVALHHHAHSAVGDLPASKRDPANERVGLLLRRDLKHAALTVDRSLVSTSRSSHERSWWR